MAKRRNYRRDKHGRFARTGVTSRPIARRAKTAAKVGLVVALAATAGVKAGPAGIRYANANRSKPPVLTPDWFD